MTIRFLVFRYPLAPPSPPGSNCSLLKKTDHEPTLKTVQHSLPVSLDHLGRLDHRLKPRVCSPTAPRLRKPWVYAGILCKEAIGMKHEKLQVEANIPGWLDQLERSPSSPD